MEVNTLKSKIKESINDISQFFKDDFVYTDESSALMRSNWEKFNSYILKRSLSLKKAIPLIKEFLKINFTKEEQELINYLDFKDIFTVRGIAKINNIIDKLSNLPKPQYDLANHNKDIKEKIIRNRYELMYDSFPFGNSTFLKFDRFFNNEFDEEIQWKSGLVIKLNTNNHINSLENFNRVLNDWHKILRAIGRVNNENGSSYKIDSLKTGSLIITITAVAGVVITLGKATNYILDIIKKSYEIKKHSIELKKIKVEGLNEVTKSLDEASKIKLDDESEKIANQLIIEIKYSGDDKNEVLTAVKKAVSSLFKFYDNGGETKLLMGPNVKSDEKNIKLQTNVIDKQKQIIETKEEILKITNSKNIKLLK